MMPGDRYLPEITRILFVRRGGQENFVLHISIDLKKNLSLHRLTIESHAHAVRLGFLDAAPCDLAVVDVKHPVFYLNRIAADRDDSLDKIDFSVLGTGEDYEVASFRIGVDIGDFVCKESVVGSYCRVVRDSWYSESLQIVCSKAQSPAQHTRTICCSLSFHNRALCTSRRNTNQ